MPSHPSLAIAAQRMHAEPPFSTTLDCSASAIIRQYKRHRIALYLRHALIHRQLFLCYQPRFNAYGHVTALEALLRWRHPSLGLVPPAAFIPVAENSNAILAIGDWAIHAACLQSRAWQDAGFRVVPIAVNVSTHQLYQCDFAARVRSLLAQSALAPRDLELEVTESAVMHDMATAAATLQQVQALGVKVALDDFGTSHSSLSSLHRLPVNYLKIDRSFVRHMRRQPSCAAIIAAIVTLAHSLDLAVIAEGVETDAQLQQLMGLRCDEFQGYLFARPLSASHVERFLGRQRLH